MWTRTRFAREAGRSRRSLALSAMTAKRSAPTSTTNLLPGRAPAGASAFDAYADYCRERLLEDPYLWAMTLFDEIVDLGFRPVVSDVHPPTPPAHVAAALRTMPPRRTRWGRLSIIPPATRPSGTRGSPDPPAAWGWGTNASLFVGSLTPAGGAVASLSRRISHTRLRPRPDHPRTRWAVEGVAVRPDRDGLPPRVGHGDNVVRWCRQALRGVGLDLSASSREPKVCRRKRLTTRLRTAARIIDTLGNEFARPLHNRRACVCSVPVESTSYVRTCTATKPAGVQQTARR
jgi:hypothetical protein